MDMVNTRIAPRVTALHKNVSMKVPTYKPTELVVHILTALGRIIVVIIQISAIWPLLTPISSLKLQGILSVVRVSRMEVWTSVGFWVGKLGLYTPTGISRVSVPILLLLLFNCSCDHACVHSWNPKALSSDVH